MLRFEPYENDTNRVRIWDRGKHVATLHKSMRMVEIELAWGFNAGELRQITDAIDELDRLNGQRETK